MAVCHIHRIRDDHSVVLQIALTTPTPGIYLARVAADSRGAGATWQLRLHCGHELGVFTYSLPTGRAVAAQLGQLEVDWRADYHSLCVRFHDEPDLDRRARTILCNARAESDGAA
jgi:hypothetical protein